MKKEKKSDQKLGNRVGILSHLSALRMKQSHQRTSSGNSDKDWDRHYKGWQGLYIIWDSNDGNLLLRTSAGYWTARWQNELKVTNAKPPTWGKTLLERWVLYRSTIPGKAPWKHHPMLSRAKMSKSEYRTGWGRNRTRWTRQLHCEISWRLWLVLDFPHRHKLENVQNRTEVAWEGFSLSQLGK